MFHGDPLMRRVAEIIYCVVETFLYNYWISLYMDKRKLFSRKNAIVHPLDGYYSFNLYRMQTAFSFLSIAWCVSDLCVLVKLL